MGSIFCPPNLTPPPQYRDTRDAASRHPPHSALAQSYDLDDSGYGRGGGPDPYGGGQEQAGQQKVLSPTKARVARGLQDLLIDLKEMKADNRRLEDLLRQEQGERTK